MEWISSFLCNRTQSVRVGVSLSPPCPVLRGIPQGTVLGPLLFLLFIDDISEVTQKSNIILYADDAKLYTEVSSISDCIGMSEDILEIEQWITNWQMKFNLSKCEL